MHERNLDAPGVSCADFDNLGHINGLGVNACLEFWQAVLRSVINHATVTHLV